MSFYVSRRGRGEIEIEREKQDLCKYLLFVIVDSFVVCALVLTKPRHSN